MSTISDLADTVKEKAGALKAKANWEEIEEVVQETTKNVVNSTARFVRENPWKAAGLAAIAGLTLAVLVKNCCQSEADEETS